jgi:hypothetical protein
MVGISKGRFTLWPKVERPLIFTSHIARNQEFGLSTLHTMAKVQRPSQLKWLLFEEGDGLSKEVWVRRKWKPKLWSRGCQFLLIKKSIIDKILAVRSKRLFWTRNKVGYSFGFGLWALAFGDFTLCPAEGSTYYIWLAMYFQPITLDSQQSLATQSHGLSTWTALVWMSGPKPSIHVTTSKAHVLQQL